MHAPPPVRVTLGFDRAFAVGCVALAALAAANLAAWIAPATTLPAALIGAAGAAALVRRRQPRGALAWDGEAWLWEPPRADAQPGTVTVALDLDCWMLLRFTPARGPRRWWPLARAAHAPAWSPLRAALYAPS